MAAPVFGAQAALALNVPPVAEPDRGTREGLVGGSAATEASNRMLSCRVVFCPRERNNGADTAHFVFCDFLLFKNAIVIPENPRQIAHLMGKLAHALRRAFERRLEDYAGL